MPRRAKKWFLVRPDSEAVERLTSDGIVKSPVLAHLLAARGLSDAAAIRTFLEPKLTDLHSPLLLPAIETACSAIEQSIARGDRICVHGDYDVDGLTGTSTLILALRQLGARVGFHIPHRRREGYGLTVASIENHVRDGQNLVITVDCGITAIDAARRARELGLALIITDHHEMRAELPDALALVHPGLPGSKYPFAGISGAMVAFKLAWALGMRSCGSEKVTPEWTKILLQGLGLAALGAVADHVPLIDENRALVRCGLAHLDRHATPGIKALMEVSLTRNDGQLKSEDVAFQLAPRLNAAGRLECARFCVDLFTEPEEPKAKRIAQVLDEYNRKRRQIELEQTTQAKEMARAGGQDSPLVLILGKAGWHPGLVGIVASRMVDEFHCPAYTIAIPPWDDESADEKLASGSARSAGGFPVQHALLQCADLLVSHGGHRAAAGFKVLPENIPELSLRLQAIASDYFKGTPPRAALCLDAEAPIDALTVEQVRQIDKLEPFGETNRSPIFLATDLKMVGDPKVVGATGTTVQLRVTQGGKVFQAVGFQLADRLEELKSGGGSLSLAFNPKVETFNGITSVKLHIRDFQPRARPEVESITPTEAVGLS